MRGNRISTIEFQAKETERKAGVAQSRVVSASKTNNLGRFVCLFLFCLFVYFSFVYLFIL